MSKERFIVDDAGTLIDMHTRDMFDIVEEVCPLLNELHEENQLLKQALRESLEDGGNAYVIDLLDKIFDLKYCEWQKKMNDTHTYDYVEWEEILEQKRDDVE